LIYPPLFKVLAVLKLTVDFGALFIGAEGAGSSKMHSDSRMLIQCPAGLRITGSPQASRLRSVGPPAVQLSFLSENQQGGKQS
jgi:hypothetical protein